MVSDPAASTFDYFISHTARDEAWAEWIAWQLQARGHTCRFQKWHFRPGNSWVVEMQKALQQSRRMIAVLSPDYLKSEHGQAEWNVFYAKDPAGTLGLLIPVRVARAELNDLHKTRVYIDLVGKDEPACLTALLGGLQPTSPGEKPAFPVTAASAPAPAFPPDRPLSTTTPHNLPRLQPFFGRTAELATIREALDPESRTWGALIDGPGGMGKTSLAIRAAYDCPPGQFERIIFVSIKEREMDDDGVRHFGNLLIPGYLALLNELARELNHPGIPKSPEDQRIRLLLGALSGTRTLLILDNLESLSRDDRGQILTFVKRLPQGCKAILTSRRRIGSSADSIPLEKLDQAAALETLADLATHNKLLAKTSEAERIQLYERTAGKPLLLRWVAGQLGRGSCRTLADALAFLSSCPPDNDPLEFIFGDLATEFTPDEEKVLCALTYFSLPAKIEHIATVAGIDQASAEPALRSLANRSLVSPDDEETEFTLVPLVAEYLRRHHVEPVRETGERLQQQAQILIIEHGYDNYAQFQILDAAWPTISPAIPLILARPIEDLQTMTDAIQRFLDFTGRWDHWQTICIGAETRAIEAGDYYKAGWRAYQIGMIHRRHGDADAVIASAIRADKYWRKAKAGLRESAISLQLLGIGRLLKHEHGAAIAACQEALALHRKLSTGSKDESTALTELGNAQLEAGNTNVAQEFYREAIKIGNEFGPPEVVALCTGNLARLALARGDWNEAERFAREAIPLSESVGHQEMLATSNHRLAIALAHQGKFTEALHCAFRAVEVFKYLDSPRLDEAHVVLAECQLAISLQRLNHGWTYNTTTLEGNTLSLDEVDQALKDPAASFSHRPVEHVAETRAQGEALKLLAELLKAGRDWTPEDLFRLHTVLMQGSTVDSFKPIGTWKIEDNGTTIKLDGKLTWNANYAAAAHVPALMAEWLRELNRRRNGDLAPSDDHIWLHATLARIHPFADGNGRMTRMLANIPLLAAGLHPVDIPAAARDRYLESLARWQIACGPPVPNSPLFARPDLLEDFTALCTSSRPPDLA